MIQREIIKKLSEYAQSFRAVLLVGPRQAGKTTLVKQCFPDKPYISLENPDQREFATSDPRAFLNNFPQGAILDEVQRAPILFNYLQEILYNTEKDGLFILTGSNNILLQENVTQTLAGRIGVLDLLPLSYKEIYQNLQNSSLTDIIIKGFYPEVHDKNRKPQNWYPSYIRTYIERDVRQIKQIEDTLLFHKFIKLCAGRIGQQLNLASFSNECGINVRTVQSWLSVLQSTYVIHLLQPFYKNFNKRIVKSPKLYFYDTGLACTLLNIKTNDEILLSHFKGALVENFIVTECIKNQQNQLSDDLFYYWRDNNGVEIDLLVERGNNILPIKIKSAQTYTKEFSSNLKKFMDYSGENQGIILYDGKTNFKGTDGIELMHWSEYLAK